MLIKYFLFAVIGVISCSTYAEEPKIQQVGSCTAVTVKTDPEKPAQVTTSCPDGQVTIQFPDGTVKIIQPSGLIIEVKPG